MEKLCSLIKNSSGKVLLQQSDKMLDIKQSKCMTREIRNTLEQDKNLSLHISAPKDYFDLVNFMIYAGYDESACIAE